MTPNRLIELNFMQLKEPDRRSLVDSRNGEWRLDGADGFRTGPLCV
jgi:hypothetical protein